jgi:hypothetical protein
MKKLVMICAVVTLVMMTGLTANAALVTYNGNISPSKLGGTVTTNLPMFNAGLGTLTGVKVTLNFTVTPYAQVMNFTSPSSPLVFSTNNYISYGFIPANIWTVTHGTDSWTLAAPTVNTGNIYGSNQSVAYTVPLILVGGTSAPVSLTAASGLDFAGYTGIGTLAFGTSGMGQVIINGGALFGGGGGNLTGTAAVTYEYESTTLVTLSSFTAKASNGRVKLEWVTESEIDNAGFNIWRADAENGEYVQLNDEIIPAKGSETNGAKYVFTDNIAKNRKTYFYKLQDIDVYGTSTFHGPVSATPKFLLGIFNK